MKTGIVCHFDKMRHNGRTTTTKMSPFLTPQTGVEANLRTV